MTREPGVASGGEWPGLQKGVLREAARASDSYGLLLLLVIIDYIVLSVGWTRGWPTISSTTLIGLTALLAFHTSNVRGLPLKLVQIGVTIAIAAAIVSVVIGNSRGLGIVFVICALLVLTSPIVVLSRILRHRQVTAETLLGAVSVYILLGLVFAYADLSVQLLGGSSFFAQSGHYGAPDFVYYSYITMTTTGYGDLTPAVGFPRTMAVLEALTGQIFLVILVARLVSMYRPSSRGARLKSLSDRREDGGDAPSPAAPAGGTTSDEGH